MKEATNAIGGADEEIPTKDLEKQKKKKNKDCTLLYLHEAKYLYFVLYERKNERMNELAHCTYVVSPRRQMTDDSPQFFCFVVCEYPHTANSHSLTTSCS